MTVIWKGSKQEQESASSEAAARAEEARLASRASLKKAKAEAEIIAHNVAELQARKADIDVEVDAEVQRHAESTAPLQAKLAANHEERVSAVVKGERPAPAIEDERKELLSQLDELNKGLSLVVAASEKRKADFDAEIHAERAKAGNITVINNDLATKLSSLELLCEAYALERKLGFLKAWKESSAALLEKNVDRLEYAKKHGHANDAHVSELRMPRYTADAEAAAAEFAECARAIDEAYQRRVAE